jgi:hypothetical protein
MSPPPATRAREWLRCPCGWGCRGRVEDQRADRRCHRVHVARRALHREAMLLTDGDSVLLDLSTATAQPGRHCRSSRLSRCSDPTPTTCSQPPRSTCRSVKPPDEPRTPHRHEIQPRMVAPVSSVQLRQPHGLWHARNGRLLRVRRPRRRHRAEFDGGPAGEHPSAVRRPLPGRDLMAADTLTPSRLECGQRPAG